MTGLVISIIALSIIVVWLVFMVYRALRIIEDKNDKLDTLRLEEDGRKEETAEVFGRIRELQGKVDNIKPAYKLIQIEAYPKDENGYVQSAGFNEVIKRLFDTPQFMFLLYDLREDWIAELPGANEEGRTLITGRVQALDELLARMSTYAKLYQTMTDQEAEDAP